jgi:hypothetical protein
MVAGEHEVGESDVGDWVGFVVKGLSVEGEFVGCTEVGQSVGTDVGFDEGTELGLVVRGWADTGLLDVG